MVNRIAATALLSPIAYLDKTTSPIIQIVNDARIDNVSLPSFIYCENTKLSLNVLQNLIEYLNIFFNSWATWMLL